MKKCLYSAVALLLLILCAPPVSAQSEGDFVYIDADELGGDPDTVILTKYTGKGGEVTIPDKLGGKPVACLGDGAFMENLTVTSVFVPDSVVKIGGYAFYDCAALKSADLPDSVEDIGAFAFYGCKSLTEISIPKGVVRIDGYTFSGCEALTKIELPGSVREIGEFSFAHCARLPELTVPDSVNSIDLGAFTGCKALTVTAGADSVVRQYARKHGVRFRVSNTGEIEENREPIRENMSAAQGAESPIPGGAVIWMIIGSAVLSVAAAMFFILLKRRRSL
ncbi:MAG: leucine-rich repeat domain-containing protein [Oscillospiraceae bacterium]|jgi:hypothetical protein|nr:leucine-rich repeat domain-containing protein [Oscillospiraceae bacterium]